MRIAALLKCQKKLFWGDCNELDFQLSIFFKPSYVFKIDPLKPANKKKILNLNFFSLLKISYQDYIMDSPPDAPDNTSGILFGVRQNSGVPQYHTGPAVNVTGGYNCSS